MRPNADTLYSASWLDVGAEPVILSVPDTNGRYYLMQFMDAWTRNGHLPAGVTALHSPREARDGYSRPSAEFPAE